MTLEEQYTYQKALDTYGYHKQRLMVFEECAELINALAKADRGRSDVGDIITELADVSIMVEQMAVFFGYENFEKEKKRKIERLKQRLE